MRISAAVIGIAGGLAVAWGQVAQPLRQASRVMQRQSTGLHSSPTGLPANLPGLPPNRIVSPSDGTEEGTLVEFEGRMYRINSRANNIPYIMVGGRTLSINGAQSAPNR